MFYDFIDYEHYITEQISAPAEGVDGENFRPRSTLFFCLRWSWTAGGNLFTHGAENVEQVYANWLPVAAPTRVFLVTSTACFC